MRDLFDRERPNLFSKDMICMVNLLEKPRVIVFFLHYMIEMLRFVRREVVFCQASMKIKVSPLSVHC